MRPIGNTLGNETKRDDSVELSRFFYEKIRLLSWIFLVLVLLSGCARHNILGTTYGWDAAGIVVLSDVQVNALKVRHVRMPNTGCASGYAEHLELHGPIGPDSTAVLDRLLAMLPRCITKDGGWMANAVFLSSGGGLLSDGYNMGKLFRKYQVATIVTGGQICASSCAVAFLGGVHRSMFHDARLMFHSPYRQTGIGIDCVNRGNVSSLSDYFVSLLGSADGEFLLDRTLSYCSSRHGWTLNKDAARLFNLTTQ